MYLLEYYFTYHKSHQHKSKQQVFSIQKNEKDVERDRHGIGSWIFQK